MDYLGREVLHRLIKIAEEIRPEGAAEYKRFDEPTLKLFWRSLSLYTAILLLLDHWFVDEALSLSRSLFTDSLRLLQISELGEDRASLTLEWMNKSYLEMLKLLYKAKEWGVDNDPSDAIEEVKKKQESLQGFKRRHGITKLAKFRPEGDAASRYGRANDYWTFLLSQEMVHGTDASFTFKSAKDGKDSIGLYTKSQDPKYRVGVAKFSGKSMIDVIRSVSAIFSWTLPDDFDEIQDQIQDINPEESA